MELNREHLSLEQIISICKSNTKLDLNQELIAQIEQSRDYLDKKLQNSDHLIYGINTGFGSLCNVRIDSDQLSELQSNLVKSHAVGVGDKVPEEIVKIMLLLKILNMSKGYSGVRMKLVNGLLKMYNQNLLPVIFELGSLGASGDLAPLAHMSLPLIGEGKVYYNHQIISTEDIPSIEGVGVLQLKAKEGIALLNGTQFSTAYGLWSLSEAERLMGNAQMIAALSIDAFNCSLSPYDADIHAIRPHKGQVDMAASILTWIEGSDLPTRVKNHVQDPYSFRCIPQVHGATRDTMDYARKVLVLEANSVTDNPNVFAKEDKILSGGNFHAQPVALILDFLAIAMAEIGNISERRIYQLVSGNRGLPDYLVNNPGINSGMMIAQYTAASVVNQNKIFCTPASVDSIVSSKGQEDHVSMAANSGTKLRKIIMNVERILAIEWMVAVQAMEMRSSATTSPQLKDKVDAFRQIVPFLDKDRILHDDIMASIEFLK